MTASSTGSSTGSTTGFDWFDWFDWLDDGVRLGEGHWHRLGLDDHGPTRLARLRLLGLALGQRQEGEPVRLVLGGLRGLAGLGRDRLGKVERLELGLDDHGLGHRLGLRLDVRLDMWLGLRLSDHGCRFDEGTHGGRRSDVLRLQGPGLLDRRLLLDQGLLFAPAPLDQGLLVPRATFSVLADARADRRLDLRLDLRLDRRLDRRLDLRLDLRLDRGLDLASTGASTGCSSSEGSACRATGRSMVGTAARIVSSRERAAGAAGAGGEALPSASAGLGVATGSGTQRATGGVSGTCGTSTSGSGSTGSTSRALSRCSRLRVSTGLGLLGLRLLRLLADRAHDDGLPALRRLTVQLVRGSRALRRVGCAAADAKGRRRCDPRSDERVPLDRRGRDSGRRQPARSTCGRRRLRGGLGRLGLLSLRRRSAARCDARASGRTGRSTTPLGAGGRQPCQKGTATRDPA